MWMKDDGAFGSGPWGGNKVRKLEWLLPEARRRGARTILTFGGLGTNWGLAAALYGGSTACARRWRSWTSPWTSTWRAQLERLRASGATIHRTRNKARTIAALPWLLLRHTAGSRPTCCLRAARARSGVLGYVEASLELASQVDGGRAAGALACGGRDRLGGAAPRASRSACGWPGLRHARGGSAGHARPARRTRSRSRAWPGSDGDAARRAERSFRPRPERGDLTVLDGWIGAGLRPRRRPRARRPPSPRASATGSCSTRSTRPRRWRRCAPRTRPGASGTGRCSTCTPTARDTDRRDRSPEPFAGRAAGARHDRPLGAAADPGIGGGGAARGAAVVDLPRRARAGRTGTPASGAPR